MEEYAGLASDISYIQVVGVLWKLSGFLLSFIDLWMLIFVCLFLKDCSFSMNCQA
jgi:hypothetical protein